MVQVVVLSANGESRTLKTAAVVAAAATGESVAKSLRKARAAERIGTYTWKDQVLAVWGWREGKAGTENKHEMPPPHDEVLLFGDIVVCSDGGDFTVDQWKEFYDAAFGGFEQIGEEEDDEDEEDEEEVEVEIEEEAEEEEAEDEDDVEDEGEDDAESEDEEDDADDDCYEDGDDGGGGKRRAPRRRTTTAPEYRRMDMGLRSRVKIPTPVGKRAPRWQTAEELEVEPYSV